MKLKLLLLATLLAGMCKSQDRSKLKFGNVTAEDFKPSVYAVDSNAAAVVIADIGSSEIIGNSKGSFSVLFTTFRRAHILNKNGYDIASVEIRLYSSGQSEEELQNLKAVTYNLENGKVIETKLDVKSAVFKDKINKNWTVKKFTFPNIKEGSIIEYEYKKQSDYVFNLHPWDFQGEHPRLWSEYNAAMPSFYNYVTLSQGYHQFHAKNSTVTRSNFFWSDSRGAGSTQRGTFTTNVTTHHWVMKDVPALKEESYTSTLRNHISRVEFQLASLGEPYTFRQVMTTWEQVTKDLMEDEDFGAQLQKDNGWLNEVMPTAKGTTTTNFAKVKNIYAWVRDNFTCTGGGTHLEQPLKSLLKSKSGNVAEINLLLTAMLRKADFVADPVILSTRSHGYTHSMYPLMDRFNYIICRVEVDGKEYYLDASEPAMGFGKLSYKCYNGHARIINTAATPVELNADLLREEKRTAIFIINDEKGNPIGSVQQTPGYFESTRIRDMVKEKGKDHLLNEIKKDFGMEVKISNSKLDSLEKFDEPVGLKYDIDLMPEKDDIMYINPMFGHRFKENPFKSAQRLYPVEMPYTQDQTFTLQMEVPTGYVVDELPKQTIVKFNEEEDAIFEYRLSQSGDIISLRSRLIIKRAYFMPDEYEILREFFNLIVKKHNEQIVFKKKN